MTMGWDVPLKYIDDQNVNSMIKENGLLGETKHAIK